MPSQSEKKISNFVEVNGIGKIHLKDHTIADVFVYGYFKMFRWYFIVHQDITDPEHLVVSEASTGCCLQDKTNYMTVEDALYYELPHIQAKQYYFATSVSNILVKYQKNLLKENLGLRTLAIDTALWI